jgi:transcriptional regulator with XRE-family HTH domain
MATDYARSLGTRLRSIRQQQGLSLQGVEEKSSGLWKAVVVGSYERGDRAITVSKLAALAEFYGVPVAELLPNGPVGGAPAPPPRVVIDLSKLATLPAHTGQLLARFTAAIQAQRGDYNGRVLSIRQEDLRTLAVLYDRRPGQLAEELIGWGVLNPESLSAVQELPTVSAPAQRVSSSRATHAVPSGVPKQGS